MRPDVQELGPDQLKALTHPLRVAILRALRTDGPATATALARRLGESSGATSYHLRQLERHGFVEDDPDRGDGRERWWRPAFRGHRVEPGKLLADPDQRGVLALYESVIAQGSAERFARFLTEQGEGQWSDEWIDAADLSDMMLRLTPAQVKRLVAKVHAVVQSFEKYDSPGAEQVIVQIHAFPRRIQPFEETS